MSLNGEIQCISSVHVYLVGVSSGDILVTRSSAAGRHIDQLFLLYILNMYAGIVLKICIMIAYMQTSIIIHFD